MIETIEQVRPYVTAALTEAGPDGFTVKELCGKLDTGEQVIRRTLAVLLTTGEVRQSLRYRPGVRGAVPRVYILVKVTALAQGAGSTSTGERA